VKSWPISVATVPLKGLLVVPTTGFLLDNSAPKSDSTDRVKIGYKNVKVSSVVKVWAKVRVRLKIRCYEHKL
jgi:hypothetical protein